ncbi:EcsC family protein [Geomonas sp. RF6]|uniref:EcsC family protein n=1 Tax=Geomonas sp. RF6 TaxID=2897342 RepID=UPI001E2B695A|nr:EcsC family protein [Geomonas sp. RF6]UFS72066.1 EcsC family protein [Geomonas sp. RF6]
MYSANEITVYEAKEVASIREWKELEPGVVGQALGMVAAPLSWLVQKVVPEKAIQGVLEAANWAGGQLADTGDILRDGEVSDIAELRCKSLELSDRLADTVHNWAIGMGTAEGAATGATGLPGMAVDIPAIITLALRTVHKIGLCYGFECRTEEDRQYVLGVLSASGANTMKDKIEALLTLRTIQEMVLKQTWKKMAEKAAGQQLSKEGAIIAIRNLAKQLGINLTKRKALQAIPVLGGGIGAAVNGSYINDVGWAARRLFQERWLVENGKIMEI